MDNDFNSGKFDSVFSRKIKAGKRRTYFVDVRQTRGDDYYITLTEKSKRADGEGFDRHKLFLYKEDFNRFLGALQDAVTHVKEDLMPNFDYEVFDDREDDDEYFDQQKPPQKEGEVDLEW